MLLLSVMETFPVPVIAPGVIPATAGLLQLNVVPAVALVAI